jgi:formylmethanofuran dehydrogenase subunit C
MRHTLVLRRTPPLRVDARTLQPALLCTLDREAVLRLPLPHGRDSVPLGEWFDVNSEARDDTVPALRLEGDLSRFDCIGAGMAAGDLVVQGAVGDCAGMGMAGGTLRVEGSARDLAGCAMSDGTLEVMGDVNDFAAGALPGAMEGMSGGTLVVHGRAGARLADRMRRGTVVVHGDVGAFLASRMVAGTVAVGGRCGAHAGWGMRRGSIIFTGEAPAPPATFVSVDSDVAVAWQLLARDLARFGGACKGLDRRPVKRWVGDLAVEGKGEWLVVG